MMRAIRVSYVALGWAMLVTALVGVAQEIKTPAGMRKEVIQDPALNNMKAFDVYVPAKWHFAGRLLQGTSCEPVPYPVFRMTSPDGLTVLERLPSMDWAWGNGPSGEGKDCLPLKQEMTAAEFSHFLAKMLKVEYVADVPFPASVLEANRKAAEQGDAANRAKYLAAGMNPPVAHSSVDRALVRFKNGSFTMKGLLSVTMNCNATVNKRIGNRPIIETHGCSATVRYVHAPEAQYEAMEKMLENAGGAQNMAWTQAWMDNNQRQTAANIQTIQNNGRAAIAQSQARHEQYMQSQATQQRMHEEFLSTMQRGTNMSMNRTQQSMNARSTATSNVVDYALDQQTVRDPNSGQVNKVSSQYSYTWVDNTGKTSYQTNDPNANPNGSLQGSWSRQQVVNGDGTPR